MWYENMFELLELHRDEKQGRKMATYMQDRFEFLGIPKTKLKEYTKPFLHTARKMPFDWGFVDICWSKSYREAQYIGVQYILMFKTRMTTKDLRHIKYLITNKSWWETADSLDAVVGAIVKKDSKLKKVMLEWSLSNDIWLRRVAIDFQQKYKEDTDKDLLAEIIINNLGSEEFFINKAIGWSLRDYSNVNPKWVEDFITDNEIRMNKLSIKEARKYLYT